MGLLKLLGLSTKHEGQHVSGTGKHRKDKPPRMPKGQKGTKQ